MDKIFERLADNESIKKMYVLWCEMEQQGVLHAAEFSEEFNKLCITFEESLTEA